MQIKYIVIYFFVACSLFSCKKPSGVGGTSTIKGRLKVANWTAGYPGPSTYLGTSIGEDISVYIVYGDTGFYNDNVKSNYDGTFQFDYLNKGKYKIFAYSDDTSLAGKKPVLINTFINKNRSVVDLGDVTIVRTH